MPSKRVLIVEDDQDVALSAKWLVSELGHDARIASDGLAALEIADEYKPEVVLLDLGLPKLSGFDVAERLRGMPGLQAVFVIAITGSNRYEDRERAIRAGCDHYAVKPLQPASLAALLGDAGASRG